MLTSSQAKALAVSVVLLVVFGLYLSASPAPTSAASVPSASSQSTSVPSESYVQLQAAPSSPLPSSQCVFQANALDVWCKQWKQGVDQLVTALGATGITPPGIRANIPVMLLLNRSGESLVAQIQEYGDCEKRAGQLSALDITLRKNAYMRVLQDNAVGTVDGKGVVVFSWNSWWLP